MVPEIYHFFRNPRWPLATILDFWRNVSYYIPNTLPDEFKTWVYSPKWEFYHPRFPRYIRFSQSNMATGGHFGFMNKCLILHLKDNARWIPLGWKHGVELKMEPLSSAVRDISLFQNPRWPLAAILNLRICAWSYISRTMLDGFLGVENMGVEPKMMSLCCLWIEILANPCLD